MIRQAEQAMAELYELDETAWLDAMAELIRRGSIDDLDYPHLGEYLTDMARRDRAVADSEFEPWAASFSPHVREVGPAQLLPIRVVKP